MLPGYRIFSVAGSHTRDHNQREPHPARPVLPDPIPDLQVDQEVICDQLEDLLNRCWWLMELHGNDDNQLYHLMEVAHKARGCLNILRHES